jgi:hypothetical protein
VVGRGLGVQLVGGHLGILCVIVGKKAYAAWRTHVLRCDAARMLFFFKCRASVLRAAERWYRAGAELQSRSGGSWRARARGHELRTFV